MSETPVPSIESDAVVRNKQREAWRMVTIGLVVVYFICALSFLFVREVLVPRADDYRLEIAAALGNAIGLPVSIDALSADLSGLRPRLHLSGLLLRDAAGRPALRLEAVDATIAWSSLLRGHAHFHSLVVRAPELALRREANGELFVAGVRIDTQASGTGFSDWLLNQREIVIRDAALTWSDAQRGAPELRLDQVNLRLSNVGGRYRFGVSARPPAGLGAGLDLRGDLVGTNPADLSTWAGQVYLSLDDADLGGWRDWVDYPVELAGKGGVRAWLGLDGGRVGLLAANIGLDEVVTRLSPDLPALSLSKAYGRFALQRDAAGMMLTTRGLTLETGEGLSITATDLDLKLKGDLDGKSGDGVFSVNRVDLAALAGLAAHLPLDESVRERLAGFDPDGHADDVRLEWRGPVSEPATWKLKMRFADIGVRPQGVIPGMRGLSGSVEGDEKAGRVRIAGENAVVDLPAVFPEPRLALSTLRVEGGWSRRGQRLAIDIDQLTFENPDAAGTASGRYFPAAEGAGEIDLTARLTRAEGGAVWRYLPFVAGAQTRDWLRDSLVGGRVPEARLRLKGAIHDFPFRDPTKGQFLVVTRVSGAQLNYAHGWPAITDIAAEVRFDGPAMRISADSARIFDVALTRVVAAVPDLDAPGGAVMSVKGRASGLTSDFLRFVSESPVSRRIDGFTDHMKAEGRGSLDLQLTLPLNHIDDSKVKGEYRFGANRLWVVEGLPPLGDASGSLRFTEKEFEIPSAKARMYGEPMQLSARALPTGGLRFQAEGGASLRAVREQYGWRALEHLSGTARWSTAVDVKAEGASVKVESDLVGLASSLPEPLNKSAAASWPLRVDLMFPAGGVRHDIRVVLADRMSLELSRRASGSGWEVERGGLGVFAPLRVTPGGVMVAARVEELDVDAWRKVFDGSEGEGSAEEGEHQQSLPLTGLDFTARRVHALGQTLNAVKLTAQTDSEGWKGRVASAEAEGEFDWRSSREGTVHARLKRLALGSADEATREASSTDESEPPRQLPGLDIVADQFVLRGKQLGRLEVQARNRAGVWHLDSVSLANPDGSLTGLGQWRPGAAPMTDLDFKIQTNNIGRFVSRLGYADAVRDGSAMLGGVVSWRGGPTRIDYPSLSGTIGLDARDGQFRKLDPGAGRLLGVLSLQSLPRRLTLDFRDVFSEGFAFDRISGSINVVAGVMRTDNLEIRGPAARVQMKGSANLAKETQSLRVTVQPTLSESIAIGAAAGLINPVAGVVTYLAQKALSDPIEKFFAFNYAVTGGWADPKVEKLSGNSNTNTNTEPEQE